jgi:hypothetical protein
MSPSGTECNTITKPIHVRRRSYRATKPAAWVIGAFAGLEWEIARQALWIHGEGFKFRGGRMQTTNTIFEAPRAMRREWIGLGVLAIACVLYAMDLTVLHLAVPSLSADLQPSSAELLWIIDI